MTKSNLVKLQTFVFTLMILLKASITTVNAQSTANYSFSTNTNGSLGLDMNGNVVDMTTGTTQVLATNTSQDQSINAAAISFPAGFEFYLGGNRFTSYFATSNGLVQLGNSAVIGGGTYTAGGGTLAAPRFSAFNGDLGTGTTGGIFGKIIGTAPNRCYVIEFRNMTQMWTTSYTNDGTFQVRFYENTGVIEYVYGSMFCNTTGSAGDATPEVGFSWGTALNQSLSVNIATSATDFSGTMIQNTLTAGTSITNLNSTVEGSRRFYRFTPPVPNAPSSLTFSNVLTGSMTLNWTDNATNEVAYALYNSTDGINFTYVGNRPANTITTTATGLLSNTLYYWRVYAITEGGVSTPVLSGSQSTLSAVPFSGIKTVGLGGDYSNLTIAFAEINANTLSGNVDLQLISGYPASPETYPIQSSNTVSVGTFNVKVYPTVSGLSITSNNTTGTLNLNNAKNITFDGRVNQSGANDLVISNTNVGSSYAILLNNDASNNTIQNCIVQSTNNSTTSGTIVFGTTTGSNGNDNNTITACDIRDGASTPSNGIYSVGTTTTAAHFNDNNNITNNNISNFFSAGNSTVGVFVGSGNSTWTISNNKLFQTATRTYTTGNTHNGIQVNNTSGNGFVVSGNTIGFASSTGTGVYNMTGTVATRFIGINISAGTTVASSVQGNTISNFSLTTSSGATGGNGIFAGINVTNGNVNVGSITPNIIGSNTGNGAIVATTSTAGGLVVGINSSSSGTVNINSNSIGSINVLGSSATLPGSVTGIQVSAGTPTINNNVIGSTVTANSINALTVATSGAQLVNGINVTSGVTLATTIQGNTISNLTQSGTTTTGVIRGITYSGTGIASISQNTISSITGSNANTVVAGTGVQGILHNGTATGGGSITNNTIHTISNLNTGAVQTNVNGIGISGLNSAIVSSNVIYNLTNASTGVTATTPPTVSGINVRSIGAGSNINNNMISLGNGQTTNTEFIGIWNNATSTSAINIYHNTINIEGVATAGALPTYSFLRGDNTATAITSTIDVRNNIFNNTRSGGTGKHYAIANQSTAPSATGWGLNASNFNVLNSNASTIGLWGSTDMNFNAWRIASSSDANSFSSIPVVFVNSSTGDLHLNMGLTATPIESGGTLIASVTTDVDSQTRPGPSGSVNGGGTSPDLGADEIDAVPALPVISIVSVTPPASTQCTTADRLVTANITTPVGVIVSANLGYTINGTPQTPITMVNVSGTTWTGTIPASVPANAIIAWAVSATNSSSLSSSLNGTPYSDEPLTGVTGTATASVTTVCAGNPSTLSTSLSLSGSGLVGTAGANSTTFPDIPLNHLYGGSKTQYIYRASELTAAGFSAGDITSLSYNVTATGTTPLNGFSIAIGHTAQNVAVANTAITAGLTNVYSNAAQPVTLGTNNFVFSTPFTWDGTSNIVVSFVYSNNNAGGTSATVTTSTASFVSTMGIRADNTTAACLFGATATTDACVSTTNSNSTSSVRPLLTFTGNRAPAITSVTWMNGATTVGTGNPLVINPTSTATYSANITASGCVLTPAPSVTVNVNPVPTAPTATNSSQCGAAIPTASVSSTSGMPTPTFNWYTAAVGGSPVQSSTSTTFTSTVSSTTTFHVSEINLATGCEGPRTAVTISVSSADPIDATASATSICIGSTVNLNVTNTAGTPTQSYTYTWQALTNSGITAPTTGAAQNNVMPTVPGTYKYAVSAIDGSCSAVDSVTVVVDPFTATVTPINATCFGSNNGSFSVASTTCGTADQYSVDGGAFSATIPTNLTAGAHTVIVQNTLGYQTSSISFTVGQPAVVQAPVVVNPAEVCQGTTSIPLTFSPGTNTGTQTLTFALSGQPTEVSASPAGQTVAANPNIISTVTMPALPAGATITSATFTINGTITPLGFSWANDVQIGFNGAINNNYAAGTGAPGSTTPFTYTRPITPASINPAGGVVNLHYFDFYADNAGPEATFPIGSNFATLTINYSYTNSPNVNWYTVASGGSAFASTNSAEAVGTSILPNTNTPGTYTFYAEGVNGTCVSPTRTAVTVTVNALPTVNGGANVTVCQGQQATLTATGTATSYVWSPVVTNGVAFTPAATGNYIVTGTGSNGCTNKDTVLVTVNALPIVSAGLDQTVCAGSSVTLNGSGAVSYTWNNGVTNATPFTATTTTTYTVTGTDANNCQNTDQVVVNVNNATSSSVSATACVTYTWAQNGMTYTTSGAYTDTVPNAVGCDSIITLNLVINQPTSSSVSETACSSFTWAQNGMTYTTSGAYTDTIPNAAGCDSIITLNLVINQPSSSSVSETACTSYTWAQNGMTYTASGAYTDTIPNAAGCDSIITLNLVINQPTSSSVSETACGSFTWSQNGMTYTASGAYTDTIPNAAGCDSIITLNLTINNGGASTETASVCGTYTWAQNGQTYTASGAYDHVIIGGSANGCDSTITLNLTINAFPTATATYTGDSILTASAGATYQWIDCATNTAIAGETAQTFQATANGSYAVVVTNAAGCSDTSACVTVNDLGLDGKEFTFINVYPNPTTSNVIVEMNVDNATIELVDAQGKVISVSTINNGGTIDLTNAERGVYFLRVRSENGETTKRIVKQ